MIDPMLIQRDSTRRLISSLESLEILEVLESRETDGFVEVLFRVPPTSKSSWIGIVNRLVGSNRPSLGVYKRYLNKEGLLAFIWAISIAANDINKETEEVANFIAGSISRTKPPLTPQTRIQNTQQPTQSPRKKSKLFPKRNPLKPIYTNPADNITIWEMDLPFSNGDRNKPKVLEDGTMSTKGAFTFSDKGRKEWSKALGSRSGKGVTR